jgi:hypothetical protein
MKGTWQTDSSAVSIPLAVGAAALAVLIAAPVAAAVAAIAQALVITIAGRGGLAGAGGAAFLVHRARCPQAARTTAASPRPVPWRPSESVTAPRRPAVEPPRKQELHLHFHGVGAEEAAEILRRERPGG